MYAIMHTCTCTKMSTHTSILSAYSRKKLLTKMFMALVATILDLNKTETSPETCVVDSDT